MGATVADKAAKKSRGAAPEGYARLSCNVRAEYHTRLKVMAAKERRSIGSIIEGWIEALVKKSGVSAVSVDDDV